MLTPFLEGVVLILKKSSGDSFSIDEFLIYKKIVSKFDDSLSLTNYDGSLKKKMEGLLNSANENIKEYFDKYLLGLEWESIPIQWGDLK